MSDSRYCIGIDLGTTNCAMASVDTYLDQQKSQICQVEQQRSADSSFRSSTLPSFLYLSTAQEEESLGKRVAGAFAREQSERTPDRVVSSAKSWLCFHQSNPHEAFLPWKSDSLEKISPLETSAAYLRHLAESWNSSIAHTEDEQFAEQQVVITVPASFDQAAQQLTLEAAKMAGYPPNTMLIEEPQAAFYFWLEQNGGARKLLSELPSLAEREQNILVIDVGGGTSDFSLFKIAPLKEQDRIPHIERVAVSEHLLLGGDNIDLALAFQLEQQLSPGSRLPYDQWSQLVFQSRALKEKLLLQEFSGEEDASLSVSISGRGSSLFAAAKSAQVSLTELRKLILDGFFPIVSAEEQPHEQNGSLQEFGLPYASDSAITRHLASFVHGNNIDAVLCNGGSLKPEFIQHRLCALIGDWQGSAPKLLESGSMDLAVAHGAAFYSWLHQTRGKLIESRLPYSLMIDIELEGNQQKKQLCLFEKGAQPGDKLRIEGQIFELSLNQLVQFQAFQCRDDLELQSGNLYEINPEILQALPLLQTRLEAKKRKERTVAVQLEAALNELGLLQLEFVEIDEGKTADALRHWRLQFHLRNSPGSTEKPSSEPSDFGVAAERVQSALEFLRALYGKAKKENASKPPKNLLMELEKLLSCSRDQWNSSLLRALWGAIAPGLTKRGRSVQHERHWLNLAGYCLRPGYGTDLDPFRVSELFRAFELGMSFPNESAVRTEWWIMWRRVAGGLDAEQQTRLYKSIRKELKPKGDVSLELIRAAVALERLASEQKLELSKLLLKRATTKGINGREHVLAALGRLGSRVPLYAGPEAVLDPRIVESWFDRLSQEDWSDKPFDTCSVLFSLAARVSGTRALDLNSESSTKIAEMMKLSGASERQIRLVSEHVPFDSSDQKRLFGEALPNGLRLLSPS